MERIALEGLHAVYACQLWGGQNTVSQNNEFSSHGITPVRGNSPATRIFIPLGFFHGRMEQALVLKTKFLCHFLAVLHDFKTRCELHGRDVIHFL